MQNTKLSAIFLIFCVIICLNTHARKHKATLRNRGHPEYKSAYNLDKIIRMRNKKIDPTVYVPTPKKDTIIDPFKKYHTENKLARNMLDFGLDNGNGKFSYPYEPSSEQYKNIYQEYKGNDVNTIFPNRGNNILTKHNRNVQIISTNADDEDNFNYYGTNIDRSQPTTIFQKLSTLTDCIPVNSLSMCPRKLEPVCAVSDGLMQIFSNDCTFRAEKKENPLRKYQTISKECCLVLWKYCTLPILNVV